MSVPTREQVEAALEKARPALVEHGGNVELVGVNDQGVVLVRLTGASYWIDGGLYRGLM